MAESVFEAVKQSITVREAAQMYGIEVNRSGMACCPFHDDKNPSMKLNEEYFYCFGCGATGDVIDFTARLYNLSPKEAAEKLAQDFGLAYDSQAPPRRRHVRQKSEAQKFKEDRDHAFRVLADYFHLLRKWETDYTPKTPEENPHPRFMEAIQKKDYVGYLLDFFLENSPEEQKLWIAEHQSEIAKLERRVKFMADKTTNRERLQEITAGIEQGIKELFESEKYMRYLSVMSKFHRYSVNNTMLIYMQRPDATLVAGFNKWKNQFERHVKKGEHGITIIAPTPYKKKIEEMKRDPDTHAPILDADGKAVMEEKEIEIPMFRPVKVFDVSQTDGKPLPELASSLSGTVPHYEAFMEALRRSAPVPIEFEPMAENMDGYFSSDQQRIAIREGMSEVQTVSAAVHETAHSKLHDPKKYEAEPTWKIVMVSEGGTKHDFRLDFATEAEAEQAAAEEGWRYVDENRFEWRLEVEEDLTAVKQAAKNRNTEEVEAESISYAVCQYFGIQTGENSFGYIASWSKDKELKELRASLETINKTSCELINDIERNYKEICKERGIDLTAATEPQQDSIEQLAADIDQFTFDYDPYEYRNNADSREDALHELTATLRSGDASGVREWLQNIVNEDEPDETTQKAAELMGRLDQLVPMTEPEQLTEPENTESVQPSAEYREALLVLDDTSYLNESDVGKAVKDSGIPREEIFITSKLWLQDYGYEAAKRGIETSLHNLDTDYIDLYLLHQPYGDVLGAWRALEEAKEAGKLRSIGVSNQTVGILKRFLPEMHILPAVNQVECNPLFQQKELRTFMEEHDIVTEAWYPLGHGDQKLLTNPVLTALAEKYRKNVGQIILRWHIQEGIVALPKATNPDHIRGNIDIFDFALTDAEMGQIRNMDTGKGTHDPENKDTEASLKTLKIHD